MRESLSRLGLPHTNRKLEIMGQGQAGPTVQCGVMSSYIAIDVSRLVIKFPDKLFS